MMIGLRVVAMMGAAVCCAAASNVGAATAQGLAPYRPTAADARTPDAVKAVDDAWGKAEERGNVAYVDWLLLPGYRSVGRAGEITTRDAILSHTRLNAGSSERAAKIEAWMAAHPIRSEVSIFGDTAVLTWVSMKPGAPLPVSSVDVFVYRDGHWRAVYSQHTDAGG